MRLWSLHPKYLDAKGIVALWREALLAKHVLEGRTKGYTRHPQLTRFREAVDPIGAINFYLSLVLEEADRRGYRFDASKIGAVKNDSQMQVPCGQLDYEFAHLLRKLEVRDPVRFEALRALSTPELAPLFILCEGGIEPWEITEPPAERRRTQKKN